MFTRIYNSVKSFVESIFNLVKISFTNHAKREIAKNILDKVRKNPQIHNA